MTALRVETSHHVFSTAGLPEFAEGSTRIKHIILAVGVVALVMDALGLKLFIYLDGTVEAAGMRRDNKKLEEPNALCEPLCFVWSRRVTSLFLDDYADLLLIKSNRFTVNILAEMVV